MATLLFLLLFLLGYCLVVALLLLRLQAAPAEEETAATRSHAPDGSVAAKRDAA
jgi:hypothetical protein